MQRYSNSTVENVSRPTVCRAGSGRMSSSQRPSVAYVVEKVIRATSVWCIILETLTSHKVNGVVDS